MKKDEAPIARWVIEPPGPEVECSLRRLARAPGVRRVAVMPDVHLAEQVCVGVALATDALVYPSAVGGDIGCGMAALALDGEVSALTGIDRHAILAALARAAPVIRQSGAESSLALLEGPPLSHPSLRRRARRDASVQLGTLGRGNHFLELQHDEDERLWITVHSGSRAMGPAIRDHHLARAPSAGAALSFLVADSDEGRAYLSDVEWARRFAALGRRLMLERAVARLQDAISIAADWRTFRDCDHNHVQLERHGDEALWIHRKGALAAHADAPGIIPGSMGTSSFLVNGRGHAQALRSSSHGAGRRLSRVEARRRVTPRQLEREMGRVVIDRRRRSRLVDEAPSAYRDIDRVMRAQRALTRIERRLWPLVVHKGS